MKKQSGFTVIEMLIGAAMVGIVVVLIAVVYVASHFIAKFW